MGFMKDENFHRCFMIEKKNRKEKDKHDNI
jgi:hypothetical protein